MQAATNPRPAVPAILLHLNGCERSLLPTDRITDIARAARASAKLGSPAALYCSGWDWGRRPVREARS